MKKRGKGSEGEEAKKSKKCLACLLVLLFVIGITIAPAAVAKGDGKAIEEINEKLEAIDEDPTINTFLYDRMNEYNGSEGIEAVKIVVIRGYWFSPHRAVKTFYVVRNDTASRIDIKDDNYEGDNGLLWTFYPKIGQTVGALDIIISCFDDFITPEKKVYNLIRLGIRAILVDKDNVPSITEIITKSPWASNYLPDGAKTFLEWFEEHH